MLFIMSSCGSDVGMETSAPLVDGIVNNALFYTNLHADKTSNQSHPALFTVRLAVPNVLRSWLFDGLKSGKSYRSLTL